MLYNIKLKAIYKREFLLCSYILLCNKKLCYIAHPNLPDEVPPAACECRTYWNFVPPSHLSLVGRLSISEPLLENTNFENPSMLRLSCAFFSSLPFQDQSHDGRGRGHRQATTAAAILVRWARDSPSLPKLWQVTLDETRSCPAAPVPLQRPGRHATIGRGCGSHGIRVENAMRT